jgi:uncharacterized protein YecE (DUF72 family)
MQDDLFAEPDAEPAPKRDQAGSGAPASSISDKPSASEAPIAPSGKKARAGSLGVRPAPAQAEHVELAGRLPALFRMGTSSWSYPGWAVLVWDGEYSESMLAKHGLDAYGHHPLMRAVGIDRGFYRALTSVQYARYAAQVPDDFRFVVKAPSAVADAMVRNENGRSLQANPLFLDPRLAEQEFIQPALTGLGHKIGALVFQLSPLPSNLLRQMPYVLERLHTMLRALPSLATIAPEGTIAVEVRDPAFLTPEFSAVLRDVGATYCLCLHPKMPPIHAQLPLLRSLWPGPFVCRWNLNRKHGAFGYEEAQSEYAPYDRMQDPDLDTRETLAKVVAGTTSRGQRAYVTISNKAEGCAPLSVVALAEAVVSAASMGSSVASEPESQQHDDGKAQ